MDTPSPDRSKPTLALLGLVLFVALLVPATRPVGLLRDFDAFYCAGHALTAGANPYLAEPLGACERLPKPDAFVAGTPGLAMPAPLPPYALLPFEALSLLPFPVAALLWTFVGLAAVGVAIWAMVRLTRLPVAVVSAAFVLTDGYASLALGQVAPIAVAAIAVAALLLARGRDDLAGYVAGLALVEPHIGLPVCAALFVYRGRARLPILAMTVACMALSFAAMGVQATLSYLLAVLPAHAVSEIANEKQFSLTYALYRIGVANATALRVGELSYIATVVAGILIAGRLAPRTNVAVLAAVPPALAVIGGPFVHIIQIASAIPAALILYAFGPARTRVLFGGAAVLLAVPWIQFATLGSGFIAIAAVVTGGLAYALLSDRPIVAGGAACASIAFLTAVISTVRPVPDVGAALRSAYDSRALASSSWKLYVELIGTVNATAFDLAKIPTVAGLLLFAYATLVAAFGAEPITDAADPANVAIGGNEAGMARRTSSA